MTPKRWREINKLLDEVMARSAADRQAFLDTVCGDIELRREVEELLTFDGEADDFLARPLFDLEQLADEPDPERPEIGSRIGAYRLVDLLGKGGMGEVYLAARIDDFEQRVALKLLPRVETRDEVLQRFRTERQIQARLEHPFIGRLLDGGTTEDGRPYFVMEHVDGLPIDVYCDHHQLSVRQCLALFYKVCEAVHCAHQHLIVHRDLKPSNILVTESGEPKLLDFGIAKLLNPTDGFETLPGSSPMTLRYASPEQLREEPISTATDVYALGVLLHRLMTGRLPCGLERVGLAEVIRRISEVDPVAPSSVVQHPEDVLDHRKIESSTDASVVRLTPESVARSRGTTPQGLKRSLRGDVDAIVLKALRKSASERYSSALEFAEDLRHHLRGEPVKARRRTFVYLATRFLSRHRWSVASAAVVLILVLLLVFQEWRRLTVERSRLEKVTVFLEELFYGVAPDERQGRDLSAREILARGRGELETFADEPELYATLTGTLGRIHHHLGHLDEARALFAESLAVWRREHPDDSPELARRLSNLGAAYFQSGSYTEAEQQYREALAMRRRLGQDGPHLVKTMNNLAGALILRGSYSEAEALYRQGLAIRRQANDLDSTAVATSLRHLGYVLFLRGNITESETLLREALAIRREHYGARNSRVASVVQLLSQVRMAAGDFEAAEALAREALAIRRERLGDDHLAVARSQRQLAAVLLDLGESPATISVLLTRALETFYRKKSEGDWEIADVESLLGAHLASLGHDNSAEICLSHSLETLETALGSDAFATREARARLEGFQAQRR